MNAFSHLTDRELGEYDCLQGYQALDGQSEAYYFGYGEQYAKEQAIEQAIGDASGN